MRLMFISFLFMVACGGAGVPAQDMPEHGPPRSLGADCVVSTDCVGSYGQGRCIVKDDAASCYAALFDANNDLMMYCSALASSGLPETCCKSLNLAGSPYSYVTGTDLHGDPCFLGVMAPWN